jgi:hypothetical protein
MSEFQYYEFQALDRSLTEKEMAALRKCSSRAKITPSRFVNHYSYGDFKGDVEKWMERYFDAFLYMANWGTRRLILRFSNQAIDTEIVKQYCSDEYVSCRTTDTHTIVEFSIEESEEGEWLEEESDALASLLPLRNEVSYHDNRLFYLGWLLCVQHGVVPMEAIEPPVPNGLGSLSPALKSFVEFFSLDSELLKSAASGSADPMHEVCDDDIEPCIAGLSNGEKLMWLRRLALEENPNLQAEFRYDILKDCGLEFFSDKPRRTVAEITSRGKKPKKTVSL